jgi:3-phytase
MRYRLVVVHLSIVLFVFGSGIRNAAAQVTVSPTLTLADPGIDDQDDMTFWLHPTNLSQSTIIASDKGAYKIFVYNLDGSTLQEIDAEQPGNIDIRYGFRLGTDVVDIVAFNERDTSIIRVYKVNPVTRLLEQIDNGTITSPNYGFTLYKSPSSGKFYAFTGAETNTEVNQFELVDAGNGQVSGVNVRTLQRLSTSEGMVADDETGNLYVAEEAGGIWKFNAEPGGAVAGTKIADVGDDGLTADVEGVTIYYTPNGAGYLIASSPGSNTFNVYQRQAPHTFVGTFEVSGASDSDGVDVINLPLNNTFAMGIFALHNGTSCPCPVEVVKWEDIATALGLTIDTGYWDPRVPPSTNPPPTVTITAPENGATFPAPADIAISADASDANGTVSKVEFFQGSTKLGEDTSAPYEFAWANVAAGGYSLTAKATDDTGATSTSAVVGVTVGSGGGVPTAPTSLRANETGNGIRLRWTQSSTAGVTQNTVYRSTTPGANYQPIATIPPERSYTDQMVTGGTTYYYVVTAVNGSGESANSTEASATAR